MNEPIRVLHMIGSLNIGGSQAMVVNLYKNIDRNKVQFDFVIDHPSETYFKETVESMGAKVFEMPNFRGANFIQIKKAWNKFFVEHPEYKILHSHVRSYASLYIPIAKKHGVKTIIHSHSTSNGSGISSLIKRVMQSSLKRKADYLFACSEESGKWLFGEKAMTKDNYYMIPNAVDTQRFTYNEVVRNKMRAEIGINNDTIVYGHVGRLHPAKNHMFLLEVFKDLLKVQNDALLLLVGDGELRLEVEEKINALEIGNSVKMLGSRGDVAELLQAMDVFLFPSKWEGLPVTVVEAQASGLPCFISDTITQDVNTSSLVQYLPINRGTTPWIERLTSSVWSRKNVIADIKKAGFDIEDSAKKLSEFYMELC